MSRKPITRTDRKVMELKLRDMLKKEKDKFQDMQNQAVKYMVERDICKKALELMSYSYFGNVSCIYFKNTDTKIETNVALFDYFINLAKEILKNERKF